MQGAARSSILATPGIDRIAAGNIIPRMDAIAPPAQFGDLLRRLAAADGAGRQAAAGEVVTVVAERLRYMARRMLRGFPIVRRYDQSDDVAQAAALRLHRALATVTPTAAEELLGLVALQVRRELVDLARKYAGAESPASHRDTDVIRRDGLEVRRTEEAVDPADEEERATFGRWVSFHEVAESLPPEERQVFEMVWYLGMSQAEIADVLGCSVRTARRRWEAARDHFQTHFRGDPP